MTIIEIKKELTEDEKRKLRKYIFKRFNTDEVAIFSKERYVENSTLRENIYQSVIDDFIDDYESNLK